MVSSNWPSLAPKSHVFICNIYLQIYCVWELNDNCFFICSLVPIYFYLSFFIAEFRTTFKQMGSFKLLIFCTHPIITVWWWSRQVSKAGWYYNSFCCNGCFIEEIKSKIFGFLLEVKNTEIVYSFIFLVGMRGGWDMVEKPQLYMRSKLVNVLPSC